MVYASSMGSLKARRVTINDLIGGSNGGATSALTISNEGSDATGSVIITAASGKTSGFTTSSNGAKLQLQGEVQLGSANHAAQVFTHSSVTTDLHLKSTNGSAGILMDPGSSTVTNTGNLVLLGGDLTANDKRLTLFTSGASSHDIYLDPRTNTAGGDVYVRANLSINQTTLSATHPSGFDVTAVEQLALTPSAGNVATTASAGNVVVTAAHNVALTPSGDLLATATGNVAVACVDATLDASNVAVVDGAQGVLVSASTAGDVELTSAAGVFALTADAATTASVVRSAQLLTIASTNADVALNAGANLTTTSYTLVGAHASGVRVVSTQSDVELEAASDVVLDPGSDAVRVVGGNTTLSLDGTTAANVVASTASLVLAAPTTGAYVSLEPQVATQTAMPLQFTSNTVSYHVHATSGPLRLRGSDASNTTIIEGNLEVAGTVNYITTDATTLLIEDKQLILNQADVSTDTTADQSGLVLNGSAYETDSTRLSVLWNKTDSANATANDDASFWRFSGGDLSVSRVIPQLAWTSPFDATETAGYQTADQVVEYRLAITGDEKLQIQKVRGRKSAGTNMNTSGVDRVVVAEYDLAI